MSRAAGALHNLETEIRMQEVEIGKLANIADGDYRIFALDKL